MIAITGISGFLGTWTERSLVAAGHKIVHMPHQARTNSKNALAWIENNRPTAVIHLAGVVDVRYCRDHPLEAYQAHVLETAHVLEAMRQKAPQTPFIYIASDKSFGERQNCGVDDGYHASFPYETSKACEDLLVESYRITYKLPITLLRFPNFFGEGDKHHERLVPSICLAAIKNTELVIRTCLDGTTRQYIYIGDAADIITRTVDAALARKPIPSRNHFGPQYIKTVGDVVRDVETVAGKPLRVKVLNQPGEVFHLSLADQNFLSYKYSDWMDGLRRTFEWYRSENAKTSSVR
ncbi:MAG: NAD-dependent epimerase/dehydratase family protein [Limisphaerales bacterium]